VQESFIKVSNSIKIIKEKAMILEYINAALEKAKYEIINDEEPFMGKSRIKRSMGIR